MKIKTKTNLKKFKTDADYYGDTEYISYSMLKNFFYCEYLYQVKYVDKVFEELKEPDYFAYGRAVDTLLTENDTEFSNKFYPVSSNVNISKKATCEALLSSKIKELAAKRKEGKGTKILEASIEKLKQRIQDITEIGNKTQITLKTYEHVQDCATELKRQPLYDMFGVKRGSRAQEIIAQKIGGIKRKGKLDYIYPGKKIIADIKTCANILKFEPAMYADQLAYYRELASEKYGIPEEEWDCYIMAVDKNILYKRSEIFLLNKQLLNTSKDRNAHNLKLYFERKKTGFYNPVTFNPDDNLSRRDKCMNCDHYPNCKFSLQKSITLIS